MDTINNFKDILLDYSRKYTSGQAGEGLSFLDLFRRIDGLLKDKETVSLAIDGNSCAGKSTLADIIGRVYDCNIFHMDDFFLPPNLRTKERLAEIGGNVDYMRFYKEVILGIEAKRDFDYQKYNCQKLKLDETVYLRPKALNVIEGSYSMHPKLIDRYDLKIFLYTEKDDQIKRILDRNGPLMLQRFVDEWIPKENEYFTSMDIRSRADLVFKT